MPNYQEGKIYKIRCKTHNNLIYVGSTVESLSQRLAKHRATSKVKKHFLLYEKVNNDWDNWFIELYENCPCNTVEQLLKREGEVIRAISTLNKNIAGRTIKEYHQDNYEKINKYIIDYRIDNDKKIKEKNQEYYIKNVEKITEYQRDYYINNSDTIKLRVKEYTINNAEKKKLYDKEYQAKHREELNKRRRLNRLKKKSNLIIKEDE